MINIIKFKKVHNLAFAPIKAYPTDSGFDLFSDKEVLINHGDTSIVQTGIQVLLPPGYEAQIRPRSGVSAKTPLIVMFGTIDNGYRGELCVIVKNVGKEPYLISVGDKIAQLVPIKIDEFFIQEVEELTNDTSRGINGFGSSGY